MRDTPMALEVANLTLAYNGTPVLRGVDLAVLEGSRVAIVGPNGAGKSTLFKGIVGLAPRLGGEVLIGGRPAAAALSEVAYVPQREEIDWSFPVSVMDVVLMGRYGRIGWFRRPGRRDRELALHYLEHLGMADLAGRHIGELSGGQQQRVFLARALAQEPRVLLLDEPFAGVDAPTQEVTLRILADLEQRQVTLLVSTHDLDLAARRFHYLALLNGRLIAYGEPCQVLTPAILARTFGAPSFLSPDGQRILAVTNTRCPAERPVDGQHGQER